MKQSSVRNSFQNFLNRLKRKQNPPSYKESPPISFSRPETRFRVLNAFKKQGLYFIDLDTGEDIDGLIDLPSIGLTFAPPPIEVKKPGLGFLSLGQNTVPKNDDSDFFELDAILFFEYDGPECKTGRLENEVSHLYFLKVWNDLDLRNWEQIVENVVKDLTFKIDDFSLPMAKFTISTTFVSNKPAEKKKLMISKKKHQSSETEAVSDRIYVPEEDYYEDHHKFKPRF